jgi:hypothetical protein
MFIILKEVIDDSDGVSAGLLVDPGNRPFRTFLDAEAAGIAKFMIDDKSGRNAWNVK